MDDAQQSANSEEKSTAGDKYDTARAMSQNVRDMNARQLVDALKDLAILQQINPEVLGANVRVGSLIISSAGFFFISIGIGEVKVDDNIFFAISPASPLGQIFLNKRQGDKVSFRGKTIEVRAVL